ncbi:hypothetical protein DERF_004163, partial [Dermatophagoides farinae]
MRRIGMAKTSVKKRGHVSQTYFWARKKLWTCPPRTVVNMSSERSLEHMVYVTSGVVKPIGSGKNHIKVHQSSSHHLGSFLLTGRFNLPPSSLHFYFSNTCIFILQY